MTSTTPPELLATPSSLPTPDATPQRAPANHAPEARWWFVHPIEPTYDGLSAHECALLRLPRLDDLLTRPVLDTRWPADLLRTPAQRMRALRTYLPAGVVLTGAGALWVHLGGPCPQRIEITSPSRRGARSLVEVHRGVIASPDVMVLAGRTCTRLERTIVDLARTVTARQAVDLMLLAQRLGIQRGALTAALERCVGASAAGRPRAAAALDGVYRREEDVVRRASNTPSIRLRAASV